MKTIDDATVLATTLIPYASGVADLVAGPELAPLRLLVQAAGWRQLDFLARTAADAVGAGLEVVATMYDDDLDPDDEPFAGVRILDTLDRDSIVVSRRAYETVVLRLLDFAVDLLEQRRLSPPDDDRWAVMLEARSRLRARLGAES
jgi:hypothetical protein